MYSAKSGLNMLQKAPAAHESKATSSKTQATCRSSQNSSSRLEALMLKILPPVAPVDTSVAPIDAPTAGQVALVDA